MRTLSFEYFIEWYMEQMSGTRMKNIKNLAEMAFSGNARLRPVLAVYAVLNGKQEKLLKYCAAYGGYGEYADDVAWLSSGDIGELLSSDSAKPEYGKIWNTYLYKRVDTPHG